MAKKAEASDMMLGFKRICPSCNARYYDLGKNPPVCPSCKTEYNPEALLRSRRNRPLEEEEEVKVAPKRAANDRVAAEETPEAEDNFTELDGEAELAPVEDVEDVALEDDETDEDLIEDTSELGDDEEDLVVVEIEDEDETEGR